MPSPESGPGQRTVALVVVVVVVVVAAVVVAFVAVAVQIVEAGSVCVVVVVGVVLYYAAAIVKCVSDGADVTCVTIEDLVSCGMLAQLGANRYLRTGRVSLTANR